MISADPLDRETPAWFDAAKLGIFVHWNAASIPAYAPLTGYREMPDDPDGVKTWRRLPYAEMYWNTMSIPGSATARYHAERYGDMPYDAFVAEFRDRMIPGWDPEPWADLFARAGARYVVLTTKTEDGFLLWPSEHRNPHRRGWQSERDVVGELARSVRAHGLRFGTYYCGGMDWTFKGLPTTTTAGMAEAVPDTPQYVEYAEGHWRELIDRYAPSSLWNDYTFPRGADLRTLFGHYLARVPDGVINNRFDGDPGSTFERSSVYDDFVTPEYEMRGPPDVKWEACRGIGTSFGYNRQEAEATYLSAAQLIHTFVDVVAHGGNLLVNVGPTATGEIPWSQAERLLTLGWWLRVNGDAVYGTRPWERHVGITGDGIGVRYTASADAVNAIVLGSPSAAAVELDVRLGDGARVSRTGTRTGLPWTATPAGARIELPEPPDSGPAFSLRLEPRTSVRVFEER